MNIVQAIDFQDTNHQKQINHLITPSSSMYSSPSNLPNIPLLYLDDQQDDGKHSKCFDLLTKLKIGRSTSSRTQYSKTNGFFDSKVLSRAHAEISFDPISCKFNIQDLGSSNGTYINNRRISDENKISDLCQLVHGDKIDFGVDILNDNQTDVLYKKVTLTIRIVPRDDTTKSLHNHANSTPYSENQTLIPGESNTSTMRFNRNEPSNKATESVAKEMAVLINTLQTHLQKSKKQAVALTQLTTDLDTVQALTNTTMTNMTRNSDESTKNVSQLVQELNQLKSDNLSLKSQVSTLSSDKSKVVLELESTKQQLQAISHNKSSGPELDGLRTEKVALQNKIRDLELKLRRGSVSSATSGGNSQQRNASVVRQQTSRFVPTLLRVLVAIVLSLYLYIKYFNGLDVLDPMSVHYFDYKLSDALQLVASKVDGVVQKTSHSVLSMYKQVIPEEL